MWICKGVAIPFYKYDASSKERCFVILMLNDLVSVTVVNLEVDRVHTYSVSGLSEASEAICSRTKEAGGVCRNYDLVFLGESAQRGHQLALCAGVEI